MRDVGDHGPLPKDHPRRIPVAKARNKLERRLLDLIPEHELTIAETAVILADLSSAWAWIAVRQERKGDQEDE